MPLNIFDDVFSAELGYFLIRQIAGMLGRDPKRDIDANLFPLMQPNVLSAFRRETNSTVNSYFATDGTTGVLLLDGVNTQTQASGLIAGYSGTHGSFDVQGLNQWFVNAARAASVFGSLTLPQLSLSRLVIAGYSAGGAIGQWVAKNWVDEHFSDTCHLITFGSPRGMSQPDIQLIRHMPTCRWMCDADPIPLVPPRAEDAPTLLLTLSLGVAGTYQTYTHLRGGVSLDPAGRATESLLPPIASANVLTSLASWYFSNANHQDNEHWIGNYQQRLLMLKDARAADANTPWGGGGDEPVENASRRELTRAQERTMSQVAHASSVQNANAVIVDPVTLFRAVRFGRVWSVEFGGQLFAFSGNKKRARHLARAGNDFLRSMPKQAVVDPDSLLSQMLEFFNASVLPGGPSQPPINTSL